MPASNRHAQHGISLFIVMVMVLLSTLLVMWSSRTALFNEMVTGADSDYQRAFEAAQAMVRDAEFDIMGLQSDGKTACRAGAAYIGCRPLAGGAFFPQDESDYDSLVVTLRGRSPSCIEGICLDSPIASNAEFWNVDADLARMQASGIASTYGAHSGATPSQAGNPLLKPSPVRAWYWVEVLPYDTGLVGAGSAQKYAPDSSTPYVYRITAVAQGLKPNSRAVVQTVFVRKRISS